MWLFGVILDELSGIIVCKIKIIQKDLTYVIDCIDTVTAKIIEKGLTPGIYYATDIISMLDVIKQNVNREINYYCNDESINIGTEGIVYEEGIL